MFWKAISILISSIFLLSNQLACQSDLSVFLTGGMPAFAIKNEAKLTSAESFRLEWEGSNSVKAYDVLISKDENCSELIFERTGVRETHLDLDSLEDGSYYFCVFARISGNHLAAKNNGYSLLIDRSDPIITMPIRTSVQSSSFHPEITISDLTQVQILWSQESGDGLITFDNETSKSPLVTASKNGLYTLKATVTDQLGHRAEQLYQFYWNGSGTPNLAFVSLDPSNAASDRFINALEALDILPAWELVQSGYISAHFSSPIADQTATLDCNQDKTYDRAAIPSIAEISVDGTFVICLQLTDSDGHKLFAKSKPIIRDTVPPLFVSLSPSGAAADGFINDSEKLLVSPIWSLSASSYSEVAYSSPIENSSGNLICDQSIAYGQANLATPSVLTSDGVYSLCVKLMDQAGNAAYGKAANIIRDTLPPTLTSFQLAHEATDGYINYAERTSSNPPFQTAASGQQTSSYTAALDNSGSALICDVTQSYTNASIPLISSITNDGTYAVCVSLVDAAGNTTFGKSSSLIRKTTVPSFISLVKTAEASDGYINDLEKSTTNALWTLTATGQSSTAYTVATLNSPSTLTCDQSLNYNQTSPARALDIGSDGEYSLCVKLTDLAGNTSYGKADAIVRDILYPSFTSLTAANEASDGYINNSEKNSSQSIFTLTASGYSEASYSAAMSDPLSTLNCSSSQSYGSAPIISNITTDGTYAVCVRLKDAAGNTRYDRSQHVIRDIVLPSVTVDVLSTSSLSPALSGTVDDPYSTVKVTVNGRNYNASVSGNIWQIAANTLPMTGTNVYNVLAVAKDLAGNEDTDSSTGELTITAPAFVSTWKTNNAGTSDSQSITLPLRSSGTYNFVVQWGDGTDSIITAYNDVAATHSYNSSGSYQVIITGTINGWAFKNAGDPAKITNISKWGQLRLGNETGYFYGASNLKVTATDVLNLSGTTTLRDLFKECSLLTDVPSIGSWDISSVTSLEGAFFSALVFNQDLSGWNTGNVTSMTNTFYNAKLFNGNVDNWDTSKVTTLYGIFNAAKAFNRNLNSWNVSKVTNLMYAFKAAEAFNGDISSWDVRLVTTMEGTFEKAYVFNSNIANWNTAALNNLTWAFETAKAFNRDIRNWNVSKVSNFNRTFYGAIAFNQNINIWDVAKGTAMANMFAGATAFDQDLGNWSPILVTDMTSMFNSSGLSQANYGATLVGWNNKVLKSNVALGASGKKYPASAAAAHDNLVNVRTWTITDGGVAP